MRFFSVILIFLSTVCFLLSFTGNPEADLKKLRKIYSKPPGKWPRPFIDAGVSWQELGVLPFSPLMNKLDSIQYLVELGKILFFDPRISGSGKISCASCHQPELSWTDGKSRSLGHADAMNKRNAPTIQNVWFYNKLFWDGRSHDLEDQAFAPINSESEMHGDMRTLPRKLAAIKAYDTLFHLAFGDPSITPDRVATALAIFQRTITSRKSRFDEFLEGKKDALTDEELNGLHLFRTKARCMNCHHGPMFSDNSFHNNGFSDTDKGVYQVTHQDADIGKFKTPSLRDVMKTGPYMHNGGHPDIKAIIAKYAKSSGPDKLIKPLIINAKEQNALLAFLNAISAPPLNFSRPELPGQ